jgi:hypothetical protein
VPETVEQPPHETEVPAPETGDGLAREATDCFDDLACPAAEAERLLLRADDARDPEVDCFRFLDAGWTPRDEVRARNCLERTAGVTGCNGKPADLAIAELAMMRIHGAGGRPDIAGVRSLVTGCVEDVVAAEILRHASAVESAGAAPAVDFCRDIGGTPLTSNLCKARIRDTAAERVQLAAKTAYASLDEESKRLFAAAHRGHAAYVTAMAFFMATRYEAGAARGAIGLVLQAQLLGARASELADFGNFSAVNTSKEDIERARSKQANALAKLRLVVPQHKNTFRRTEEKWAAFQLAEMALYEQVFGPAQGSSKIRAALSVRLAERRAADLGRL